MDQRAGASEPAVRLPISRSEFIAISAALMALNALAIDVMLPAMQQIGEALGVDNENHRQYIISAYILGFGIAQLFIGPLSDRFGRRPPLLVGILVYLAAGFASAFASDFATLLALRVIQGIGAAATRVISVSVIRDVFGGRRMAEVMSLVMMVFMIVPVIAPGIGQVVLLFFDWPMIFVLTSLLGLAILVWVQIRLPETLRDEYRRAFTPAVIVDGFRIVVTNRLAVGYTIALTLVFGALFGFINSAQQIYVGIYDLGVWFPVLFGIVAGAMGVGSFLNAQMVGRAGMRRLAHGALLGFIAVTGIGYLLSLGGPMSMWAFTGLFGVAMVLFAWIGANFNSLAMEPLGHVAGTASSVLGFCQTAGSGIIGALIGQAFDGTVTPLAAGYFFTSALALVFVLYAERGRLFGTSTPSA